MSIPDKIPQALHNEEVCDHLLDNTTHYDWVVTTAFYSALHFVQSKMFPLTLPHPDQNNSGTVTLNCFDIYYANFRSIVKVSKHEATARLVTRHIPSASVDYRRLKDMCQSARYNNHQVSEAQAKSGRKRLKRVKAACGITTGTTSSALPSKATLKK